MDITKLLLHVDLINSKMKLDTQGVSSTIECVRVSEK